MNDEVYDVLDESGRVIARATWKEVHAKGLLHQGVIVFVFKDHSKQELLVHHRSKQMQQAPGLLYGSAGGHMLSGDPPLSGAYKELHEELFAGHKPPHLDLEFVASFRLHDLPGNFELVHLFSTVCHGPFTPTAEEIDGEPFWMSWQQVHAQIAEHPEQVAGAFIEAVKHYHK